MRLYDYYRSSACYRVRIALNLKNINYDLETVHLVNQGGEQFLEDYSNINPQHLVPTLEIDGVHLNQSLAIIEYLDERFPLPALLPKSTEMRARARSIAQIIACDIHPLNNLRVLQYLKSHFLADEISVQNWYSQWIHQGFTAIETILQKTAKNTNYCVGKEISIADICLVPQVYNARRFKIDMSLYPRIEAIDKLCGESPAFISSRPDYQSNQ